MTAPNLRLVDDEGVPHEILRLREVIADRDNRISRLIDNIDRLSQELHEEKDIRSRFFRENNRLKGQLLRQQKQDADDEVVKAIFNFWAALKGFPRNLKLGPKRVEAISGRFKDEPPSEPKDFLWPILGIVLDPTPKSNGIGYHDDLEVALRNESQFYKYACRGRESVGVESPRDVVETLGGTAALSALDALLALQNEMYPPGQTA